MIIWQAVTDDELELPVAQADTFIKLTETLGISYGYARKKRCVSENKIAKINGYIIYKIDLEETDNE